MDRPPYAFYDAYRQKIEDRAARCSPRPMAEPFEGALVVGFFALLVAVLALAFGGDPDLSDHRREGIAEYVSMFVGGVVYLYLRAVKRAFNAEVERAAYELWARDEGVAFREVEASRRGRR